MLRQPLSLKDTNELLQSVLSWRGDGTAYGVSASQPMMDRPWREVELKTPWEWRSCHRQDDVRSTTVYALLLEGDVMFAMGGGWGADADPPGASGSQWFQIDRPSGSHYVGLLDTFWSTRAGHTLIALNPQGELQSLNVTMARWGQDSSCPSW